MKRPPERTPSARGGSKAGSSILAAATMRSRALLPAVRLSASLAVLAFAAPAAAQYGSGGVPTGGAGAKPTTQDNAAPKLTPPTVRVPAEPVYPPERLAKGERGTVVLELTLDKAGQVTEARVVTSAGPDFDAAAVEAAKKAQFDPARRDGEPIPAKIRYTVPFDFKEVPKPIDEARAARLGSPVGGVVRTPSEQGVAGALVTLTSATGAPLTTTTDAAGSFNFDGVAPGRYQVRVDADAFAPFVAEEDVTAGSALTVTYRLEPAASSNVVYVRGERPPREVTRRVLEAKEIARIPGTNGDALRSLQNLPGVARPPGLAGLLIVRGSAPNDTNVFIDGVFVPIVYHFGGLTSIIPTELLDRIDFYPGNFGPEYGRVMGGIVDIGLRSPRKDKVGGLLQADLLDGRVLAEGPLGKKTRFTVAARRSWVDAWLKPVLENAGTGVSTAPVYYDYQAMLERDLGENATARVTFLGSDDRLALTLNSPSNSDPALGGDVTTQTSFWRLIGRTEAKIAKGVTLNQTVSYGRNFINFNLGSYYFDLTTNILVLRTDLRAKVSKAVTVAVGLDWFSGTYDVGFKFPPPREDGVASGPFFARPAPELSSKGDFARPAAYVLLDLTPVKGLKLLPGLRADYTKDIGQWDVSPRFAARYALFPEYPRTTLKGGVGLFYQPPQFYETIPPFGRSDLKSNRAIHYDLGFEQDITREIDLSVDAFYKDLSRLVVQRAASSENASGVDYSNNGSGRVYGLEILAKYKPTDKFFGWLAYTLSRSDRRNAPDEEYRLFQYDQTHIFTILGSYKLGRGWSLGARWRYVSGSMYTANLGGLYDADAGAYDPITQRPPFGSRLGAFHQLDIRVDKLWDFKTWRLSAYLDLLNAYNRRSPEAVSDNFNYTKSEPVSGLPLLPIIGLRGEL